MKTYEINEETLAVIGLDDGKTKIIEEGREYIIEKQAYDIMDDSCKYFGSSYEGRVSGSRSMLEANYKLPIIVEESRKIIFFPTESPNTLECTWISLHHCQSVKDVEGNSEIYFKNGEKIRVGVSKSSLNNQISRSTRLEYVLNERKSIKNG